MCLGHKRGKEKKGEEYGNRAWGVGARLVTRAHFA